MQMFQRLNLRDFGVEDDEVEILQENIRAQPQLPLFRARRQDILWERFHAVGARIIRRAEVRDAQFIAEGPDPLNEAHRQEEIAAPERPLNQVHRQANGARRDENLFEWRRDETEWRPFRRPQVPMFRRMTDEEFRAEAARRVRLREIEAHNQELEQERQRREASDTEQPGTSDYAQVLARGDNVYAGKRD